MERFEVLNPPSWLSALRGDSSEAEPLRLAYAQVRAETLRRTAPLSAEDMVIQSMEDTSPTKWHLAHTTWFFERFVLIPFAPHYRPLFPDSNYLFNSYYESVGQRFPRSRRGMMSRPSLGEVLAYRNHVDQAIDDWLLSTSELSSEARERFRLGLHHEQQHQELILTDIQHVLWSGPVQAAYDPGEYRNEIEFDRRSREKSSSGWIPFEEDADWFGHDGDGFAFDNEQPKHRRLVHPFALATHLVRAGAYEEFISAGGYSRSEFWLSAGWAWVQSQGIQAPLYWRRDGHDWLEFTLWGWQPICADQPVRNLSHFEADAYARWAGCRLPTEFEWEFACRRLPAPFPEAFGSVWQWTSSAYLPYPHFRPAPGAVGEYNGKFMCNQMVLRGSSFATPSGHERITYRNFFPSDARWQFAGFRLAKDLE